MKLRDILNHAAQEQPDAWLFLPGDHRQWTLDTEAFLLVLDVLDTVPETGEPILPPEFVAKGLRETLDAPTIVDCVQWADGLSGRPDDAIRFESFLYYVRFDAFLPQIGAPEPPPWDETRQLLDLEFYDGLGSEDSSHPCRRDGCSRGAVQHSVLCKRHHFEMVKHRECPF